MAHISIVIPVYRVPEGYFQKCMESVLNQTLSDLEVILVDDGSPDQCGELCDAYAKKDSRVRVIHQENQGVSVARNNGMAAATGKWLMFVDADDWIELDTCKKIVDIAERMNVQILRFALMQEWEKKREEVKAPIQSEAVLSEKGKRRLILDMLNPQISTPLSGPYCALFALNVLKKSGIQFPEGIPWGEDQIFQMQLAMKMESIVYYNSCLYHYRARGSSATGKYRDDYDRQQERYMNQVENIVYDNMAVDGEIEQIMYIWRCGSMQRIIYQQYFHPDSPLSHSERIIACDTLVKQPKNNEALEKVTKNKLSLKYKIYVFCLRNRMYAPLVLLKRVWNVGMRRKAFE